MTFAWSSLINLIFHRSQTNKKFKKLESSWSSFISISSSQLSSYFMQILQHQIHAMSRDKSQIKESTHLEFATREWEMSIWNYSKCWALKFSILTFLFENSTILFLLSRWEFLKILENLFDLTKIVWIFWDHSKMRLQF